MPLHLQFYDCVCIPEKILTSCTRGLSNFAERTNGFDKKHLYELKESLYINPLNEVIKSAQEANSFFEWLQKNYYSSYTWNIKDAHEKAKQISSMNIDNPITKNMIISDIKGLEQDITKINKLIKHIEAQVLKPKEVTLAF